jgi:hypothetical protein
VGGDLIPEEIEIDPGRRAPALAAAQDLAIETPGRGEIADVKREMEWAWPGGGHGASGVRYKATCALRGQNATQNALMDGFIEIRAFLPGNLSSAFCDLPPELTAQRAFNPRIASSS